MSFDPTTLDDLETAFEDALRGITPTHQRSRDDGWRRDDATMGVQGRSAAANRVYNFDWGDEEEGDPETVPFGKAAYSLIVDLSIDTQYNISEDHSDKIWNSDHRQLRDVFQDLCPGVTGLINVQSEGVVVEEDESGHAPDVSHLFKITYFKART